MIQEGFDIKAAEVEIESLNKLRLERQGVYKNKVHSANAELHFLLFTNCPIDTSKNHGFSVYCSEDRVTVKYMYDINQNSNYADIHIGFAKEYDVKNSQYKANAEKYNLNTGDIIGIQFSGYGIDLLKNGFNEVDELYEYSALCSYLAKDFRNNGEFFTTIKEYYAELNVLFKEIEELHSKLYRLSEDRKKFMIGEYEKEFIKEQWISDNNVIVVKHKSKEFATFTVTKVVSKKKKYFSSDDYNSAIKYLTIPKGKETDEELEKFYLFLNARGSSDQNDIERFYHNLACDKFQGEEIVLYTLDEWETYKQMMWSEENNIKHLLDDEHYSAKSEFYKEMYYKRS